MVKPGISVIICCYNSASRLGETLKFLSLQTGMDDSLWEIIVVDNASTDNTSDVAKQTWVHLNQVAIGFKILHETTPGKTYALKKGIQNSAFEFILVCDDDNWLHADYLARAFRIMRTDDTIGVLGGCGIFHPEMPVRQEITAHKFAFVNGPQTWAEQDHWVYGAGCIFRKQIISDLFEKGWTPMIYGKNVDKMAEDVEICYMCYLNGYRITSDDTLLFEHFVPLAKQRISYILDLIYRQAYAYILLTGYCKLINNDVIPLERQLNNILVNNVKAFISVGIKAAWRQLKGHKTRDFSYYAAMNTYKGSIFAVIENKSRIISQFKMLSNKRLINQSFRQSGSLANK